MVFLDVVEGRYGLVSIDLGDAGASVRRRELAADLLGLEDGGGLAIAEGIRWDGPGGVTVQLAGGGEVALELPR